MAMCCIFVHFDFSRIQISELTTHFKSQNDKYGRQIQMNNIKFLWISNFYMVFDNADSVALHRWHSKYIDDHMRIGESGHA